MGAVWYDRLDRHRCLVSGIVEINEEISDDDRVERNT